MILSILNPSSLSRPFASNPLNATYRPHPTPDCLSFPFHLSHHVSTIAPIRSMTPSIASLHVHCTNAYVYTANKTSFFRPLLPILPRILTFSSRIPAPIQALLVYIHRTPPEHCPLPPLPSTVAKQIYHHILSHPQPALLLSNTSQSILIHPLMPPSRLTHSPVTSLHFKPFPFIPVHHFTLTHAPLPDLPPHSNQISSHLQIPPPHQPYPLPYPFLGRYSSTSKSYSLVPFYPIPCT